jgi:hypothetical protein
MGEIVDLRDKIKRYFKFTPAELRGLIIAILVVAFIFSFKEWGYGEAFNAKVGLFNYFNALLIVALSFLVHISVQRVWSLVVGHRVEWKMWSFGLLASLILAFLTNGFLWWLILPGGFMVHHMAGHRLGWFRYDINYWDVAVISCMGALASILLAVFFKVISVAVASPLIHKAMIFNIAYAVCSLLPIPPLDGSRAFYGSRMLYAFSLSGIVAAAILLNLPISAGIAVLCSVFVGFVLWLLYYVFFEYKAWRGG